MAKRKPVAKKITKTAPVKTPPLTYSQTAHRSGGVELILRSFTHKREQQDIRKVGKIQFSSVSFPQWTGGTFFLQGSEFSSDHTPVVIPPKDVKRVLAALKKYGAVRVPASGGKKAPKAVPSTPPPLTYTKSVAPGGDVTLVLKSFTHTRGQGPIKKVGGIEIQSQSHPEWSRWTPILYLQGKDSSRDGKALVVPAGDWPKVEKALAEYGAVEVAADVDDTAPPAPPAPPVEVRVDLKPEPGKSPAPLGTCAGVLEVLDRMACALDSTERRKLWDVLTALRGPDTPEVGKKSITTAVIRTKAFPLWMTSGTNPGADTADSYLPGEAEKKKATYPTSSHFCNHARAAFEALGLTW